MNKIFVLALLLLSPQLYADGADVKFNNGWIKQLPPVVPMRAGYMQIENPSMQDIEVTAIRSDFFESVEIHESMMADGMMKMVELDHLLIPAGKRVDLKPGSKHLMLITPKTNLQLGDKVDLIITFSDKTSQTVQLEVRQ
jgi:copper(I)-binding protein